jgi:hypothetical protein
MIMQLKQSIDRLWFLCVGTSPIGRRYTLALKGVYSARFSEVTFLERLARIDFEVINFKKVYHRVPAIYGDD